MPLPKGYVLDQPTNASKLPPGYTLDRAPTSTSPAPQSMLQRIGGAAADMGKGVLEGGGHTLQSIGSMIVSDRLANKIALFAGGSPVTQAAKDRLFKPANTSQKIGYGLEQAAEFLVPAGAEEKIGATIAAKFPRLAATGSKLLASSVPELNAAGKIVMQALTAGTVNSVQGGSFAAGAAGGAVAGGIGVGAKALAPIVAETAMGVRAADRAYGRTPGQFIIDNTKGVNPGKIADQASAAVAENTAGLNSAALQSEIPVDLMSSRDAAAEWLNSAVKRNNASTIREVGQIGTQLDARPSSGAIPQFVPADEGLALRRGIDDLQGSWNPAVTRDFSDRAVDATRTALGDELEQAIPGYRQFNANISTALPVAARAEAKDLNAGIMQRVIGRAARPTGALIGASAGATAGYHEDGLPGAIAGGAAGLFAPEILSSPTTLMMGARGLNALGSPIAGTVATALQGAAQQADRPDYTTEEKEVEPGATLPVIVPKGEAAWAALGAGKLQDHISRAGANSGITTEQIDALGSTPQGKSLLIQASDLAPGSAAMTNLVKEIAAQQ